nr:hypothetical protein CFP56_14171 [Quercus suber]
MESWEQHARHAYELFEVLKQIGKSHLLILEIIQSKILKEMIQGQNSKSVKSSVSSGKKNLILFNTRNIQFACKMLRM